VLPVDLFAAAVEKAAAAPDDALISSFTEGRCRFDPTVLNGTA